MGFSPEETMGAIDADAHVIETEATFAYVDDQYRDLKPRVMVEKDESRAKEGNAGNLQREYWVLDGRIHTKELNMDLGISQGSREMTDVQARLDHMDALDIDVQVLYPTLFLRAWTKDPLVDYVICQSYNRWLADIWKQGKGRLRWVVLPPLLSMDKVAGELAFAKENGAVGVFIRGLEHDMRLDNPYFFPMYEAAQALDLPICFHAGNGSFAVRDIYASEAGIGRSRAPVIVACESLLLARVPERFPDLRWGFIEVSSQWVPYVLNDVMLRKRRKGEVMSETILADNNMFVACQVTDDLDFTVPYIGEDQAVIGTDYGHSDNSTEILAMRKLRDDGKLAPEVADKILNANARVFYGL
jgi:predicted TIM-barrel fold metal-dependent hydrolase